jgi:hypothetical protein
VCTCAAERALLNRRITDKSSEPQGNALSEGEYDESEHVIQQLLKERDLHLVLGPGKNGKPIRFVVKLDGTPPGGDHGADTDAAGAGTVQGNRLYQLIRRKGAVEDRTFEIDFLDPGVEAFAFTFG